MFNLILRSYKNNFCAQLPKLPSSAILESTPERNQRNEC